ncbi:hypothetical protein RHMOL_Rhmol12G0039400 [Rhododendron molle]|uniref:Uncharacterized protein n=1 Tax=Rhododendron molle TaxID=49168 RepID=A0ACC0LE08_RHOML|nr:hypothetical protein RHMOL_Rhmol12G0039400 [Rhododendron molle]
MKPPFYHTYLPRNGGSDTDSFFRDITLRFPNHVCLRAANLLQRLPNQGIMFLALLYVQRNVTPGRWFLLNHLETTTLLHLKQILLFSLTNERDVDCLFLVMMNQLAMGCLNRLLKGRLNRLVSVSDQFAKVALIDCAGEPTHTN